jgi:hypothetical protein
MPVRVLMNRIVLPSGDQLGSSSQAALVVRRTWLPPSAFQPLIALRSL